MDPFLRRRTNTGVPENLQVYRGGTLCSATSSTGYYKGYCFPSVEKYKLK